MSNIVKAESFSLTPKNLEEAMKYAEIMAKSAIIPKGYFGKPGDIMVAVQMGAEIGLKPIQALQNIAVINGKPSIYGDACLALVKTNAAFEDIKEYYDDATETAICEIKRKGQSWHKSSFSKIDAQKAGLWGKPGPWTQYTKRMQQMRARGFCVRDVFPDALQGLILAEEAQDYPMENVTPSMPQQSKASQLADLISAKVVSNTEPSFTECMGVDYSPKVEPVSATNAPTEPQDFFAMVEELKDLVIQYEIPGDTVNKWLEKADASSFEEMPDEAIRKCITYIKEKHS